LSTANDDADDRVNGIKEIGFSGVTVNNVQIFKIINVTQSKYSIIF
jgi:hypothetical protein